MNIQVGQKLPKISISNKGEITLNNSKIEYSDWSSEQLNGKVRLVVHFAGKTSAKSLNEPLIEALKKAKFPKEQYQTTTIINLKEAIWGTGAIATGKAETGKKEYPWSSIVLDASGAARAAWQLKKDSSAVFLLNKDGQVLFCKEGKLSKDEISDIITDIDAALDYTVITEEDNRSTALTETA